MKGSKKGRKRREERKKCRGTRKGLLVFPVTVGNAVNLCPAAAESASPEPPQDYVNNSGEKKSRSSCTFNEIVLFLKKKREREKSPSPLHSYTVFSQE